MNPRLRIAIFASGGAAPFDEELHIPAFFNLVERLSRSFDIMVFSPAVRGTGGRELCCGDARIRILPLSYQASYPRLLASLFRAAAREHREHAFDLCHGVYGSAAESAAVLAARRFGIPSVVTFAGGETARLPDIGYGNFASPLLRILTRRMAASASALTVLTGFQQDQLRAEGVGRDAEAIPFGVPIAEHRYRAPHPPREPFRLIFTANLIPVKNPELLLRIVAAARARCALTLDIFGEDRMGGAPLRWAQRLGIRDITTFHGYRPHEAVLEHLRRADALLVTSRHEAQSVAAAEAAASGVLICGTPVGLLRDLGPEATVPFDAGDPERCADLLVAALRDSAGYTAKVSAARSWVEAHDIDWSAEAFGEVYRSLAGRAARQILRAA